MPPYAAPAPTQRNVLENFGFYILLFFVFGVFSAFIELVTFLRPVRPMLMAAIVGLCIVIITGRLFILIQHKVGLFLLVFTGWMICCIPTSIWQGGSFQVLINEWQKAAFTFFLVGGLIWDYVQCRKLIHAVAYAAILLSLLALRADASVLGRLIMPDTRYVNPNDLAMILLTALPCLGFMAVRPGNGVRRLIAIFGSIPVLVAIAKTGSRAALIGAAVMVLIVFWQASLQGKVKLLVLGFAAILLIALVLPSELEQRFFTIFGDEESIPGPGSSGTDAAAIGSTHSRKELLLDSIYLTIKNPVFGVGPGMFPVAQDKLARSRGADMGNWHVTHNTYTQVSSECGLPGLLFFMGAVVCSFRALGRIQRMTGKGPAWDDMRLMANTLRISMWCFCSIACFASVAYLPFLTILCGLTVGLEYVADSAAALNRRTVAAGAAGAAAAGMYRRPSFSRA